MQVRINTRGITTPLPLPAKTKNPQALMLTKEISSITPYKIAEYRHEMRVSVENCFKKAQNYS
jgi:hypothetical protein